jgi:hypothetical protein
MLPLPHQAQQLSEERPFFLFFKDLIQNWARRQCYRDRVSRLQATRVPSVGEGRLHRRSVTPILLALYSTSSHVDVISGLDTGGTV